MKLNSTGTSSKTMHRSLALLTLIFCALLSQPLFAIEKIKLKPVVVVNAQSAKPAKWARARAYWYEEKIKNNIRHYKVKFLFQVSNKMAFEDIDSDSTNIEIKTRGNTKALITAESFEPEITLTLESGREIKLRIEAPTPKQNFKVSDCKDSQVDMVSDTEVPFFFKAYCWEQEGKRRLQLSFDANLILSSSTIFEIDGKGENWLVYDLTAFETSRGKLADYVFNYKGKDYQFKLVSTKPELEVNDDKTNNYSVGLGYANLALSGNVDADYQTPTIVARAFPQSILGPIMVGFDILATIPLEDSESRINLAQLTPYAIVNFFRDSDFILAPLGSFGFTSQEQAGAGLAYEIFQAGAGARLGFKFGGNWWFTATYRTDSIGSQVISDHSLIEVEILKKGLEGEFGYSFSFQQQTVTVLEEEEAIGEFTNQMLAIGVNY